MPGKVRSGSIIATDPVLDQVIAASLEPYMNGSRVYWWYISVEVGPPLKVRSGDPMPQSPC